MPRLSACFSHQYLIIFPVCLWSITAVKIAHLPLWPERCVFFWSNLVPACMHISEFSGYLPGVSTDLTEYNPLLGRFQQTQRGKGLMISVKDRSKYLVLYNHFSTQNEMCIYSWVKDYLMKLTNITAHPRSTPLKLPSFTVTSLSLSSVSRWTLTSSCAVIQLAAVVW